MLSIVWSLLPDNYWWALHICPVFLWKINLIKAHWETGSWPFSSERFATFPPQADHVLVDLFSSAADGGTLQTTPPHPLPHSSGYVEIPHPQREPLESASAPNTCWPGCSSFLLMLISGSLPFSLWPIPASHSSVQWFACHKFFTVIYIFFRLYSESMTQVLLGSNDFCSESYRARTLR